MKTKLILDVILSAIHPLRVVQNYHRIPQSILFQTPFFPQNVQFFFRVRTQIWLWFSRLLRDKITFFRLFKAFCSSLWKKNITKLSFKCWNFLYNVFFYFKYRIGLKFSTLNFRCFVSWTARKLTNALVINSVIDICIFQVSIIVFRDFSRLFQTIFKASWGLENFYIKFQDFPYFSRICTNPVFGIFTSKFMTLLPKHTHL